MSLRTDRRGTSTALGYVLALGIAAILISGLLIAGGGLMESQRDQATRLELEVVGQTLAEDVTSASRLADCPSCEVRLRVDLPERVAGESYRIEVNDTADPDVYRLVLSADSVDVSTEVRLRTRYPVQQTTVASGTVIVEYDPATDTMEVRND
jgi:hypothetical protein